MTEKFREIEITTFDFIEKSWFGFELTEKFVKWIQINANKCHTAYKKLMFRKVLQHPLLFAPNFVQIKAK